MRDEANVSNVRYLRLFKSRFRLRKLGTSSESSIIRGIPKLVTRSFVDRKKVKGNGNNDEK